MGIDINPSVQHMLNCGGVGSCHGGSVDGPYQWIKSISDKTGTGISYETSNPYFIVAACPAILGQARPVSGLLSAQLGSQDVRAGPAGKTREPGVALQPLNLDDCRPPTSAFWWLRPRDSPASLHILVLRDSSCRSGELRVIVCVHRCVLP